MARPEEEGEWQYFSSSKKIGWKTGTSYGNRDAWAVGMYPKVDFCPNIPYGLLTPNHLLYDLLYNPNETLFMKKGQAQGAVTKNGLEMLLLQAFAGWEIWNK